MAEELSMDQVFIKKLSDILEINFENELFGVAELSDELGVSRSQLHRKLYAINGKSASQFIREYRLEKAMAMLQDNVATALEIAYRVGFSSPTYFNTSFKDFYGYTPGEVKLRNHLSSKVEKEIQSSNYEKQNITIKRKLFNRRTFLIVALAILLIATFSYYKHSNSKNTPSIENKETVTTNDISIAVLPFKNWTGDLELEYISDGMTDAIISKLSGIQAIDRVVPFTSILQYKDTDKDISTIAEELGVQYVLEGNFKLSGNQVQSNLKLIEVESNKHLWSMEYSGAWVSEEIFKMQAAVAENVAQKIRADATKEEIDQIQRVPTENSEAYMLYLEGFYQTQIMANSEMENSIPIFEKAIALDSSFIEPYLALGDNYLLAGLVWGIFNEQEAWSKAKPYFEKALELDSLNGGKAHDRIKNSVVTGKFYFEWDLESMEAFYKAEKSKSNPIIGWFFSDYLRKVGRFEDAMTVSDKIIAADPNISVSFMFKGVLYFFMGREEKALKIFETYNATSSHNYFYLMETAKYYYYMDKIDLSKQQLQQLLDNFDDRPPIVLWLMAVHAQSEGNTIVRNETLEILQSKFNDNTSGSPAWFIALYYCHTRDYDSAFEWLENSYERHEVEMMWLKEEPLLRPLRTDPRYIELYDKVGFSKIAPITPYVN